MANDFSNDPNCMALFRFESGALTVDSQGTNTLTNNGGVAADPINYMEGAAAAAFNGAAKYFSITDANLDTDFPLKNGDTNKKISITCRYRPTVSGQNDSIISKRTVGKYSFHVNKTNADAIKLVIGNDSDGGATEEVVDTHGSALTCDGTKEYFIAVTYDNADKSYRIHVYDLTVGATLGTDATGNSTNNINAEDADFEIGRAGDTFTGYLAGNIDEIVVFKDILTTGEINSIRAQTYGALPTVTANAFSLLYDIAGEASGMDTADDDSTFSLDCALEYARPFKRMHSQDTTETVITLDYDNNFDTLFLGNCNFSSFRLADVSNFIYLSTVMDKDSGTYNAFIRLSTPVTTLTLTIPAQATTNGESFFAIGSIVAGTRSDFTARPQYQLKKDLIENVHEKRFDGQNREISEIGRPYHILSFNWNAVEDTEFDQIEDAIREIGQDGVVVVYENNDDYEASYITQMIGDFVHPRILPAASKTNLRFRELV